MGNNISEALKGSISRAIEFRFSRSSGPGGQNVNKVETKVEVRVDAEFLPISHPTKIELLRLAADRGWRVGEGTLIRITDQTTRSRERNREAALKKLYSLISKALIPIKKRKKSSVPRSQKERRLTGKKERKKVKEQRKSPKGWE